MSLHRKIRLRTKARALRVRNSLNRIDKVRISIFRSLNHMYAQVINDKEHQTLASCSTLELKKLKGSKKDKAHAIGIQLAERAKKLGITEGVFDRGSFLYHGRVKAFAEGLRAGGFNI